MTLAAGTRLGSYEVTALLGVGGMGEVYRARDTKLGRDVALKILPSTFTHDVDRVARFRREAQLLASLNHPNIAGIYGLDEPDPSSEAAQAIHFLSLEFVEGGSLAARLAAGPLSIDETLAVARQIVEALEVAHEKGIIHRDLKPANIALTPDGQVKILDFGLAKALEPAASADQTMSPTITFAATQAGLILGTAAYMSPEQAKGRAADKRSDVWSFGCVLFEMLAGRKPFEGEDVSDTLASVLRAEPDWNALPESVPPSLRLLVRKCLEKDRRRRIGDVSTIRFLLDEQLPAAAPAVEAAVPSTKRLRWPIAAAGVAVTIVAAALGGVVAWRSRPSTQPPIVTRFPIALGEKLIFTNTSDLTVAISPDGSRIAYIADRQLYVRSLGDLEAQPIRGTEVNPRRPMFSPDGQAIAFFSPEDRALKRIDIAGGAPVTVTSLETALENTSPPLGGTWSGDSIFFGVTSGPNRGIVRAPDNGGKPEVVVKVSEQEWADAPQMLPDGEHLLFTLGRGTIADRWEKAQIIVQSLKSGDRKVLIDGGSDGRYLKSGHLLYAQGGVVFATRFDSRRLEVAGGTVPILQGVRRGIGAITSSAAQYSVSDTGSLVYIPGPITIGFTDLSVALLDRKGALEGLKFRAGPYRDPRVSPDGKQLAVATDDGKDAAVWLYGLSGAASIRRLTQGGKNRFPVWSHDGQRVFFQSDRDGDAAIFWQRADGTGAAERLTKPETGVTHVPESASPDGKWLLFGSTKSDVVSSMTLSLPDRKTAPFGDVRSTNPINAVFSPDGKWVAYTSRPAGSSAQIYVQPFPASGVPYQVSREKANPHHPFWSRDGRDLYYVPAPGQFAYIGVTTSPAFAFSDPVPLSRGPFSFVEGGPSNNRQNDATPDGRVVAIVAGNPMQAAPSGAEPQAQLQVVLNWVEELKARLPTK